MRLEVIGVLEKEGASIFLRIDGLVMVPAIIGPKFFDVHSSEGIRLWLRRKRV